MIYLDNNSTTQPDHNMLNAAKEVVYHSYGNPSAPHEAGMDAKDILEEAREKVAKAINARPSEIIFTSGGTEANSLALHCDGGYIKWGSAVEHPSIYDGCKAHFKVDEQGQIHPEKILAQKADWSNNIVSVMMVNNETGILPDPNNELWKLKEKYGFILHVDAVQGFGKLPIDVENSPIDMLSISAHKVHGLKGAGALYVSRDLAHGGPSALFEGGKHERGLRPGTENQMGIYSLGYMAEKITTDLFLKDRITSIRTKRDRLEELLKDVSEINGSTEDRVGNVSSLYFPHLRGRGHTEIFLDELSVQGVCASRGSACSIGDEPSRVLKAMYGDGPEFRGNKSIRFSLSVNTTGKEIEEAAEIIKGCISADGVKNGK